MILTKIVALVKEASLPLIYWDVVENIGSVDQLIQQKSWFTSKFKTKDSKNLALNLIDLVATKETPTDFIALYDTLDLFEFINNVSKIFNPNISPLAVAGRYPNIKEAIINIDEWILENTLTSWIEGIPDPLNFLKSIFTPQNDTLNIEYWIRLESYKFISNLFEEINNLDLSNLNFNPYLLLLLNFNSIEEAMYLPFEQIVSRKLSGKWGLMGENILRHNYAVRSELREFDLKKYKWDPEKIKFILYHYEIKSMPAGTMRGAEEKKFFEKVLPLYQGQEKYKEHGFMLGGLYQSNRVINLSRKIKRMKEQNPEIHFIAYPRVVIGGRTLWEEFTGNPNFLDILRKNFSQVTEEIKLNYENNSISGLIDNKRKELIDELKKRYKNLDQIIINNF